LDGADEKDNQMKQLIFQSGRSKVETPKQISIPKRQIPYTMPLHYPDMIRDCFSKGDHALFMFPESWLTPEYCKLGFQVLSRGYDLVVPLREHQEDPIMYTGLLWMVFNDVVKDFLQQWQQKSTESYPWRAFHDALYESGARIWYAPSTWWKQPTFAGMAVIIPCYNHERFLLEAVNSAIRAEADQIIIVDDGSPGDVASALKSLARSRAPIFVLKQENKGLPSARNAGIRATTMSHCIALDADDKISDHYISRARKAIIKHTWLYTNVELFGEAQRVVKPKVNMVSMTTMQPTNATTVVPKHAWQFVGGYDETIDGFESWDFLSRLMQAGWSPRKFTGVAFYRKRKGKGMLASKVFKDKPKYLGDLVARNPIFFRGAFKEFLREKR
jgi:hypothetical protein